MVDTTLQPHGLVAAETVATEKASQRTAPRAGEALDFDHVYVSHVRMVWRLLLRLGVAERDVEDVLQEVFAVVSRKLDSFDGRSAIRTWIYAIAVRVARARKTREFLPLDPEAMSTMSNPAATSAASRGDPFRRFETLESFEFFQAILSEMEESKRQIFVLYEVEQLDALEISAITGVGRFTIYTRLRAARKQFQRLLAQRRFLQGAKST